MHQRIAIAGVSVVSAVALGGIGLAFASGSSSHSTPSVSAGTSVITVHTQRATVAGNAETILVNARNLPLYYYRPDTATTSHVTGKLAQLWPPLTSTKPTGTGLTGMLTAVKDGHGHQVAYDGHLLYTFVSDRAGRVTGQGFQNFFVATPNLASLAGSAAPAAAPTQPASGGYGY